MRVLIGLAGLLAVASCSGGDESAGTSTTDGPEPDATQASIAPARRLSTEDRALVDMVLGGVDQLLAVSSVEIVVEASDDAGPTASGSALVQREEGTLRSSLTDIGGASSVTTDRIVVGNDMYVRFATDGAEPADWTLLEIDDTSAAEFVDEAYTAFGAVGASLDRISTLAENVPVIVSDQGERTEGSIAARVILLEFAAADVGAYLAENQLERVGSSLAHGTVRYEFWVDEMLVRLVGSGTQFFDGEPIEDVETRIQYRISRGSQIERPQASDIVIES